MKLDRNKYLESRSLKPKKLLIAIIAVNLILGLVVWIFPNEGISFGDGHNLKFISWSDLTGNQNAIKAVDIEEVIGEIELVEEHSSVNDSSMQKEINSPDRSIQIPSNNQNVLNTLIKALTIESKTKVVRILHYGDSQLEGDRITDYLRNRFQIMYGGEGPGIVLPNEPAATARRSAFVSQSTNLKKKAIYTSGKKAPENRYGIGGATFMFTGPHAIFLQYDTITSSIDSTGEMTVKVVPQFTDVKQTPSFLMVKNGNSGYKRARTYNSIKLIYNSENPFLMHFQSDRYTKEYLIEPSRGIGIKSWNATTTKQLKLDFIKGNFPEIYGLALDGKTGVAVDNFAMRGSSAIGFDKMDRAIYQQQLQDLNVRCIIMQYGINVVPSIQSDYGYYKNILVKQLTSIKASYPGVSIIVIGPSDMSKNSGGKYISYSNIPLINSAMKQAAFETGCAFWDLYAAMGGENSMSAWVEKGLAQKDYTHFSFNGAQYVGEMLFEAILEQVQKQ